MRPIAHESRPTPIRGRTDEARDVLRAGLSSAAWITVDDTGARHKAANGVCTHIGNAHFAWFGTTSSKCRGNFLELLRAGHGDYVIKADALAIVSDDAGQFNVGRHGLCWVHTERPVHKLDTFTGQFS